MGFNLSASSLAKVFHLLKESAPTEAFRLARTNKWIHYITLNSTQGKWIPCEKDLRLHRMWWGPNPYVEAGVKLWNNRRTNPDIYRNSCGYCKEMPLMKNDTEVAKKLQKMIEKVAPQEKSFVFIDMSYFIIDKEIVELLMDLSSAAVLQFHYCLLRITLQELRRLVNHLQLKTLVIFNGYSTLKFDNLFLTLFEGTLGILDLNTPGIHQCPDIDDQALTNWTYKPARTIKLPNLLTNITIEGIIKFVKDLIERKRREVVEEAKDEEDSDEEYELTSTYDIGYIKSDEKEIGIARNEFTEVEWSSKRDGTLLPSRRYTITVAEIKMKFCFRAFTRNYNKITRQQARRKLDEFERQREIRDAREREPSPPHWRRYRQRDFGGFDSDFEEEPFEVVRREEEEDSCHDSSAYTVEDSDREDIVHILGETYQEWYDIKKRVCHLTSQSYDKEDESQFIETDTEEEDNSENNLVEDEIYPRDGAEDEAADQH